jgi:hypothetical protein
MPTSKKLEIRPSRPVCVLSGPDLELYSATAAALIRGARLNKSYPDPERSAAYLAALAPSIRPGLEGGVDVDLSSGLPSLKDLASVEADARIGPDSLREWVARPANRPLGPAGEAKAAYYRRLAGKPLGPLWKLEARLRRVDRRRGAAAFQVVYDRYDPAETVFARYTILIEQDDADGKKNFLRHRGDYTGQTNAFREKIERFTQDDSELAFLLLGGVPGLRVEEITRGRIGPLWSPWALPPEEFRGAPGPAFILHLPLDRASLWLEEDRTDDPFSTIYRSALSSESRELVEEQARRLRYRVHKDRKFSVTRGAGAALRARLQTAGTRNIVYEI